MKTSLESKHLPDRTILWLSHLVGILQQGVYANTTSTAARTSSENVTSRFCNHFSIIKSHYACKMCSNYPGIKLEPALIDKKTKFNIYHDMVTSSTQLQNRSFHVEEGTRTSAKCQKCKLNVQVLFLTIKYANLWRPCFLRRRGCVNSLILARYAKTRLVLKCAAKLNIGK